MAADKITSYKAAYSSGESKFMVRVGADNDVNTTNTQHPEIVKVLFAKDIADSLQADTLAALKAITLGNLYDAAYGADADIP